MDIRSIANTAVQPNVSAGERSAPVADQTAVKSVAAPVETAVAVPLPNEVPDLSQLTQAVKTINKAMADKSQGIEFSVDSDINRTIVKVVDQQTKTVIRQIPSEEAVEIAKALDQVQDQAQGLLFSQKA